MAKIIATIGPNSNNSSILGGLNEKVHYFRINMSHTDERDIELRVKELLPYDVPIILDTEGPQVRSGNTHRLNFNAGEQVYLYNHEIECNDYSLFFTPSHIANSFQVGDKISLAFYSVLFQINDISTKEEGYVTANVIHGGVLDSRKAVHIESPNFVLPVFSSKDYKAFEIGNNFWISHYTLSFTESKEDVKLFRQFCPNAKAYSKIESMKGLENFKEIAQEADGILIDRGDLSSQVPIELIPLIQKNIINYCNAIGKPVFIATDTLQHMFENRRPNAADANDMISTLLDGADGIALTKETATGKYPVETVDMLIKMIEVSNNFKTRNYLFTPHFLEDLIKDNDK